MKKKSQPVTPELSVGKIIKMDELEFKRSNGSNYDAIYAALAKLKPGGAFTVPVPDGVNVRTFHNRTNAAIRRGAVKPPEGCVFRKRTTTDGLVAICCVKENAAAPKKGRKPGKKADEKPAHPQAE